ncbi:MAG: 16S rRNA (guanine(966)-N(2))-methyltransferase RsmD [Deltaproteobacteria bacterium HGW-Deltaproteobacteria-7]|jgi:16S rRNA (guanine966-N2)-methyltransferase|nr:MAG: 16S rRNA (guanine(966)-N(2))-methyltransferase RsmD [Deltaproteobacteria bacterium HGW-Deltaproteobacteria-7]PKN51990.1 MAG: 16S rRNA (guanine(966)-N(2))-methyltransferase RsmD [Deltaproteobacteria bacterium HGW-Deltaproteobacteria-13]
MRIIGGKAKGRTLHFPSGSKERPTSDFLREALFNILGSLEDVRFLDLFAGSGSVGLEAASRGAQEVCFVEKNKNLSAIIKKNIQTCCLEKNCRIIAEDVEYGLNDLFKKKYKFDIIFADPPYNRSLVGTTLNLLKKYQIFKEDSVFVIQHSIKESFTDPGDKNIYLTDQRKYGDNALTFFKMEMK